MYIIAWFCVTDVCVHVQIAALYHSFTLHCGTARHCEKFTVSCFILWNLGLDLIILSYTSEA